MKSAGKKKNRKEVTVSSRSGHLQFPAGGASRLIVGGYSETGPLQEILLLTEEGVVCLFDGDGENPLDRLEYSGCLLGEEILIHGGLSIDESNEVSIFNDLWAFNLRSKKWALLAEQTAASERCNHVCIAIDADLVLVHGGDCMAPLGDCWVYRRSSNTWQEICSSEDARPPARHSHAGVLSVQDGRRSVVIFGGISLTVQDDESVPVHMNDLWIIDASLSDPSAWTWQRQHCHPLAPSPRDHPAMVCRNSKLIIFGGYGLLEEDSTEHVTAEDEVQDEKQTDPLPRENMIDEKIKCNEEVLTTVFSAMVVSVDSSLAAEVVDDVEKVETDDDEGDGNVSDASSDEITVDYLGDIWLIDLESMESICLSNGEYRGRRGSTLFLSDSSVGRADISDNQKDTYSCFGGFSEDSGFFGIEEINVTISR